MDYETLRLIWWALLGILLIGFAVMDGFDLGTALLMPFLGKTDLERRVIINTVGPVWEGNQVWFILGGGAIFAAWPALYAASFSGFYLAMFLVLATLILRPGGFKYRSKLEGRGWRRFWDWALFAGGLVPALVFGVAFGNLFRGVPFGYDSDLRFHSTITLISLLNPFALLFGLVSLSMIALHGASWINLKTEGVGAAPRARRHALCGGHLHRAVRAGGAVGVADRRLSDHQCAGAGRAFQPAAQTGGGDAGRLVRQLCSHAASVAGAGACGTGSRGRRPVPRQTACSPSCVRRWCR